MYHLSGMSCFWNGTFLLCNNKLIDFSLALRLFIPWNIQVLVHQMVMFDWVVGLCDAARWTWRGRRAADSRASRWHCRCAPNPVRFAATQWWTAVSPTSGPTCSSKNPTSTTDFLTWPSILQQLPFKPLPSGSTAMVPSWQWVDFSSNRAGLTDDKRVAVQEKTTFFFLFRNNFKPNRGEPFLLSVFSLRKIPN